MGGCKADLRALRFQRDFHVLVSVWLGVSGAITIHHPLLRPSLRCVAQKVELRQSGVAFVALAGAHRHCSRSLGPLSTLPGSATPRARTTY